jgi:hypothetical protein
MPGGKAPIVIHILYNKRSYGLKEDALVIERLLKKTGLASSTESNLAYHIKHLDINEPHSMCDIQFHLEVPIYAAIPWGRVNVMFVNPEQWVKDAYDPYVGMFDAILCKDKTTQTKFQTELSEKGLRCNHIYSLPWTCMWSVEGALSSKYASDRSGKLGFICFVAGSTNKYEFLKELLPHWGVSDPALHIYTTRSDVEKGLKELCSEKPNITIINKDLDEDNRKRLQYLYSGHLICSRGEGFAYAGVNAEVAGAFTIMNRLPVFNETFGDEEGVAWLSSKPSISNESVHLRYEYMSIGKAGLHPKENDARIYNELQTAFHLFKSLDLESLAKKRQQRALVRFEECSTAFCNLMKTGVDLALTLRPGKGEVHVCPPVLMREDCPPISVITPTYNRRQFIDIAFHNLIMTDYPHDKIEWVVVEDSDDVSKSVSDKVIQFQVNEPNICVKYIPLPKHVSIGEKRNIGIEKSSNDIILFMDDDDHYPETSFRRRVAWLTKGWYKSKERNWDVESTQPIIACCTSIALYDLLRGVSAVNVPPFNISLSQRISEATLTFHKKAWEERQFSEISIAEGESWISGRENQVIEIPPQQIIVAFSHGQNKSSRRIPPSDSKPACFWGFPKEYLMFIHKLAGIEVEEEKDRHNSKRVNK